MAMVPCFRHTRKDGDVNLDNNAAPIQRTRKEPWADAAREMLLSLFGGLAEAL